MKSKNRRIEESKNSLRGFTLVEMLLVIGIIAVLIGASMVTFSRMSKSADKAKAQELVSEAATALAAIYDKDGVWPKAIREANADVERGKLDSTIALILAKRGYMSLSTNKDKTKLVGRDRFGVLTPWASKVVERKGSEASEGTMVNGSQSLKSCILNFAVDLNGDGEITEDECGKRIAKVVKGQKVQVKLVRATAVVWCSDKDGKGQIQSWHDGQTTLIK